MGETANGESSKKRPMADGDGSVPSADSDPKRARTEPSEPAAGPKPLAGKRVLVATASTFRRGVAATVADLGADVVRATGTPPAEADRGAPLDYVLVLYKPEEIAMRWRPFARTAAHFVTSAWLQQVQESGTLAAEPEPGHLFQPPSQNLGELEPDGGDSDVGDYMGSDDLDDDDNEDGDDEDYDEDEDDDDDDDDEDDDEEDDDDDEEDDEEDED
jgi:hypothetical protein